MHTHIFAFLFLFWLFPYCSYGINANISYSNFQNYTEIYVHVSDESLRDTLVNGQRISMINVLLKFKNTATSEEFFKKATIHSPHKPSILHDDKIYFGSMLRYKLPNGRYQLTATVSDALQPSNNAEYKYKFQRKFKDDKIQISDIQLLESFQKAKIGQHSNFVKHGFYISPYPYLTYPTNINKIQIYFEIYNSLEILNEDFAIKYYLQSPGGNTTFYNSYKRLSPKTIHSLFLNFDISGLSTGEYNIIIEIQNKSKKILAQQQISIWRKQSYFVSYFTSEQEEYETFVADLSEKEIDYALESSSVILTNEEKLILNKRLVDASLMKKQIILYNLWKLKHRYKPKKAFMDYMKNVAYVEEKYGFQTNFGYETDRGRILLLYGHPTSITPKINESNQRKYEVWEYVEKRKSKSYRFIFMKMSKEEKDYNLIYSNCDCGIKETDWQAILNNPLPQMK